MISIPDDPIISCIERTGYPPWMCWGGDEDDYEEGDSDVFYGNETEDF